MASSVPVTILSIFLCFSFSLSFSNAQSSFRPRALVLPVQKDASTLQYVTKINQRTPSVSISVVVDLGGQFFWVDCQNNYVSSTYRPVRCRSSQCSFVTIGTGGYCLDCFLTARPGCSNNTCTIVHENPATHFVTDGEAARDVLRLTSTDGSNPVQLVTVPQFIFSCSKTFHLESLASGTVGVAGLGRDRAALPSQLASAFSIQRKFAICLSGSTRVPGVLFFGDGPYNLLPNIEAASFLKDTPLLINPVSTATASRRGEKSDEYFIGVKSIRINNKPVKVNTTLLSFDKNGNGGTKISTSQPYTVLESSIFKEFSEAFITEAAALNIKRVSGVAPFEVCFSSQNVVGTRLGARVPQIDLVLQNSNVVWSIFGSNSMVSVNDNKVLCLGFVDGGSEPGEFKPRTSIVIGGYQLEDNLLQFDLAASRLGFTSTLLGAQTTCANFNFTSAH